jgi:hypothetical protein
MRFIDSIHCMRHGGHASPSGFWHEVGRDQDTETSDHQLAQRALTKIQKACPLGPQRKPALKHWHGVQVGSNVLLWSRVSSGLSGVSLSEVMSRHASGYVGKTLRGGGEKRIIGAARRPARTCQHLYLRRVAGSQVSPYGWGQGCQKRMYNRAKNA